MADTGPCMDTAETRNASLKGTPAPSPVSPLIIQQPQPIGDKVAPSVRD